MTMSINLFHREFFYDEIESICRNWNNPDQTDFSNPNDAYHLLFACIQNLKNEVPNAEIFTEYSTLFTKEEIDFLEGIFTL